MRTGTTTSDSTIDWLLAGDPSIRWQTMRDLAGASPAAVARERRKVEREGWGAGLLAKQGSRGTWAGGSSPDVGLYTPKWTSTTYTMLLLRDFGLVPSERMRAPCRILLDQGQQPDGGVTFGASAKRARGETCITGMVLSLAAYFELDDPRLGTIIDYVLKEQMADGGWNCRRHRTGTTHSSVNTTISVLEALYHFERSIGRRARAVRTAQQRGREFLLVHRLFRSHRTGAVMKSEFTRLVFPPRWHYDILRALDHFRAVNAPRDPRLGDAIDLLRKAQGDDGCWPLRYAYKGETYFQLERIGAPSRWNTLRALRVLEWWNDGR